MVGKVLLVCVVSTFLMFKFPPIGRPLGLVVGLCLVVLAAKGAIAITKVMIKFFNHFQDSEIQK